MSVFHPERAQRLTLDWLSLSRAGLQLRACRQPVRIGGCDWISHASIEECLATGFLEDVSEPQTAVSHHASRVASFVVLLSRGVALDPVQLHVTRTRALIFDGSHRLRAYEYLARLHRVPALVTGRMDRVAPFRRLIIDMAAAA